MEWKIELIGNKEILNHLSNEDEDIKIEDGKYILRYRTNLNYKPRDVEKEIDEYLRTINSYLEIAFNYPDNKIDYESFYFIDENGHKHEILKTIVVHVGVHANIMSLKVTRQGVTTETHKPLSRLKDWLELAQEDEHVKRVSDIINYNFNSWVSLYNIVDVLIYNDKYEQVLNLKGKKGRYYDEIKIFTYTANSYTTLNVEARHGKNDVKSDRNKKLPETIAFTDAKNLIKRILDDWIDYKRKYYLEKSSY